MEYLELAGMQETGLARVVRECAHLLSLRSFFTAGPAGARALGGGVSGACPARKLTVAPCAQRAGRGPSTTERGRPRPLG